MIQVSRELGYINNIQLFRLLASVSIVWYHATGGLIRRRDFDMELFSSQNVLSSGVDLFFVISGFVMAKTMQHNSIGKFLRGRLIRIVPIYWLLTVVMVFFYGLGNVVLTSKPYPKIDTGELLSSMLFVSRLLGFNTPVLYPGWTLEYEMAFYVVCALSLIGGTKSRYMFMWAGILTLTVFYPEGFRFIEFGVGALVFFAARRFGVIRIAVRWPLLVGLFALVVLFSTRQETLVRSLTTAVLYGFMLFVSLAPSVLGEFSVRKLGDISYPLYLIHVLALEPCFFLLNRVRMLNNFPFTSFLIAATLFTIVCAWITHRFIEKPIDSALRQFVK
jgi:exopolysaccharide production protein ExoZ